MQRSEIEFTITLFSLAHASANLVLVCSCHMQNDIQFLLSNLNIELLLVVAQDRSDLCAM